MKWTRIGEKSCNWSCVEIDQEMDAILLIIDIANEFVESSLNQYNNALISYFVNLIVSVLITDKEPSIISDSFYG
jgi:hypothetical protein